MKTKIKTRFTSLLIACAICVFFIFQNYEQTYADAGLITIVGEGIGAGGLAAAGAAGVALGPILAVVGAALAGYGIYTNISEGAAAQGITKTEYIGQELSKFADKAGQTIDLIVNTIGYNIHCTTDGLIKLGDAAVDKINQFVNWITGNTGENFYNGDIANLPVSNVPVGSIDGFTVAQISEGDILYLNYDLTKENPCVGIQIHINSSSSPIYVYNCPSTVSVPNAGKLVFVSSHAAQVKGTRVYLNGTTGMAFTRSLTGPKYGLWYEGTESITNVDGATGFVNIPYHDTQDSSLLNGKTDNFVTDSQASIVDSFYGDLDAINQKREQIEGRTGSDVIILNPGLLDELAPDIPADKEYGVSVPDYLDTLQRVIDQDLAIDMPVEDLEQGIVVDLPIDDGLMLNPELTLDPAIDYPQEEDTPVLNPDIPAQPNDFVAPMLLDLTEIFPFCIPFDIYALLQKFVADPVAPSIHVQFTVPIVNADVDYNFSLAPFNTVALILRNVEMALLIVGLAVATRRIYLRG